MTARRRAIGWLVLAGLPGLAAELAAQGATVAGTLHNLSVSGPGEIRSVSETEVCKFCHVPHNAVEPVPLWGHALPAGEPYQTPETRVRPGLRLPSPQPDGASRLCLSCHDGTVALGEVAGESQPIAMRGAQRLEPDRHGFLGTDLSGSHPISMVVSDTAGGAALAGPDAGDDTDMMLRPLAVIRDDARVRLDSQGKMQCTTCHDPHDDRNFRGGAVPHFWVSTTVEEVCLACHEPR